MLKAIAERAYTDDPKAKQVPQAAVGSVIVVQGKIIASSANVLPPPLSKHFKANRQAVSDSNRYHVIEHAERAVIFKALLSHVDLSKATIYCTRFPCSDCARAIVWSGIKRAVFLSGFAGEKRWLHSQRAALQMMRAANITVRYLPEQTIS